MRKFQLITCSLVLSLLAGTGVAATPDDVPVDVERQEPQRQYPEHTYERVYVEMRDGIELAVDIWRPVTPKDVKVPVILSLTPYHLLYRALDTNEADLPTGDAALFVPKGYAYARADLRGTYNSGGCWDYGGIKEREDGYDLVEWFGTRGWSNGKVAMTGGSYDGTTANAAAVEKPPHLATIVPVSAISRWWGYAYQQAARASTSGEFVDIDPPVVTPLDFMTVYGFFPPLDPMGLTRAEQVSMRWQMCERDEQLSKGYTEPDYGDYWMDRDYLHLAKKVEVPVLIAHGLQDYNVKTWEGTAWFEKLRTEKMLVLGQWAHSNPRSYWAEWDLLLERWFERWLYGVKNGVEHEPSVRVQSTDGQWYAHDRWGPAKTRSLKLGDVEVTLFDDGTVTESEMLRGPGSDRFVRVDIENSGGLRIQGRPVLRLKASSDSPGTHFVAVLCEVSPSGSLRVVSRAFMNARYRKTLKKASQLEPGKAYTFDLEFIDKDHIIAKDSHLALFIASSSTTWIVPDSERATNTIDLSRSRLLLPALPVPG